MSEHFKQDHNAQETDLDIIGILRKMQQQLNFLEIKIDKLMGQSGGGRPSFGKDRRFGKPFRPGGGGGFRHGGDRPQRDFGGDRPGGDRDRGEQRSFDQPFEKRGGPERGRKAFFKRMQNKNRGGGFHK